MMRSLIFLYGLPGVGKLTVAKELSSLTGYPLYHNHLTSDLVYSVFPRGDVGSLLKQKIRNIVIEAWAKEEPTSLITTLIYKKNDNEEYFEEMSNTARKYGINVYYFHLTCSLDELKKRVSSEDRKLFAKITDWKDAVEKMEKEDMTKDLSYPNNFKIDTTHLKPQDTAKRIIEILSKKD